MISRETLDIDARPIHLDGNRTVSSPSAEHPFSGQQVSLVGKLSLFSRRDTRALVERLGGVFSSDLTPRTTIVVTGDEPAGGAARRPSGAERRRSLSRGRAAGPRDAAVAVLLGARSARHVSDAPRRSPAIPRKVGPRAAGGGPVLVCRPARRQAGGDRDRARARRCMPCCGRWPPSRKGSWRSIFSRRAPSARPPVSCRCRRRRRRR